MTAAAVHIPTLSTARLTLRPHVMADFPAYAAFYASDRAQWMGGPLDRRGAWNSFASDVAQWALMGHGAFAIEDRETGAFLGQVAVAHPPHFPERELGWFVLPDAEGRGIAAEAAVAARDWCRDALPDAPLVSYIARQNAASIRLAERLGARPDPDAPVPHPNDSAWRHPEPLQ